MAITAELVKTLRERTGAGMMECKKALTETNGDIEAAIEYLRKRGMAAAAKRAGRSTSEGIVGILVNDDRTSGTMAEVNCETDFVARTDDFRNLVKSIAEHIAAAAPLAVDKDQIPAEKIESERRIFTEQVKESGKPANLVDKIVEGKIEAFYKEVCLLNQPWVRDDKRTVGELVKEMSGKTGENIQVRRFSRFMMGEA
jgi:elongation factor Ts